MNKLRFAPSPTGFLHVGNFRTALINYLFSQKISGEFILRIDNTDTERSTKEFEVQIKGDLSWSGIKWNSSFRQSDRLERYDDILKLLIKKELVYPCYEDTEELNLKRKSQLSAGKPPVYDRSALKLSKNEIDQNISKGKKPHYRFFLKNEKIIWDDLIRGKCNIQTKNVSDPIIVREDGRFIYTLASVIDDMDFNITHILRGEDHVTNSAIQIQIFNALDYPPPKMGHLSLMTDIQGHGLSKRLGSLSILDLKKQNIEPQALNSYLAKIGSSKDVELKDSIDDLIAEFDISNFSKAPTKFDYNVLNNLNVKYFQRIKYEEILKKVNKKKSFFSQEFWNFIRTNVTSIKEINDWLEIIYGEFKIQRDDLDLKIEYLKYFPDNNIGDDTWTKWLSDLTKNTNEKKINIIKNIRYYLTGKTSGPEMSSLLKILGKDRILKRLSS